MLSSFNDTGGVPTSRFVPLCPAPKNVPFGKTGEERDKSGTKWDILLFKLAQEQKVMLYEVESCV